MARKLSNHQWHGPYMIKELVKECIKDDFPFPDGPIVYIVTERSWNEHPTSTSKALYIGMSGYKNKLQSRARIGALISNMLGFFKAHQNKRHRGGERIFKYCKEHEIKLDKIHIAWCNLKNPKELERDMITQLNPILNIKGKNIIN